MKAFNPSYLQVFFVICFLFAADSILAQDTEWVHTYGSEPDDEVIQCVAGYNDEFVYVVGRFSNTIDFDPGLDEYFLTADDHDMFIQKISESGDLIWAQNIQGDGVSIPTEICIGEAGDIYITGRLSGEVDFDPSDDEYLLASGTYGKTFVAKYLANGDFAWARRMTGGVVDMHAVGLTIDDSENVYATGNFYGTIDFDGTEEGTFILTPLGDRDIYFLKLDKDGNFIWAKQIGGNFTDYPKSITYDKINKRISAAVFIEQTADLDPQASFDIYTADLLGDMFIETFDTSGTLLWVKHFSNLSEFNVNTIKYDSLSNLCFAGNFKDEVDFDPSPAEYTVGSLDNFDAFCGKLNEDGDFMWVKIFPSAGSCLIRHIEIPASQNIFAIGEFSGEVDFNPEAGEIILEAEVYDMFCLELSGLGNYTNIASISGESPYNFCHDIFVTSNDEAIFGGQFKDSLTLFSMPDAIGLGISPYGDRDAFLVKLSDCSLIPSTIYQTAEYEYTVPSGDETYTETGTYTDTISVDSGCDTLITLHLTICHDETEIEIISCGTYIVPSGDETYATSGTYLDTLTNIAGCDSILSINLTVVDEIEDGYLPVNACEQFLSPSGDAVYTTSGIYEDIVTGILGCDSLIVIELTIHTLNTEITLFENLLVSNAVGAVSYQWIDCDADSTIIEGETNQIFTPSENGNYAVIIENEFCTDTSGCFSVESLNLLASKIQSIVVFPNPSNGEISISVDTESFVTLKLYNLLGEVIIQKTNFDSRNESLSINVEKGIYLLEVSEDEKRIGITSVIIH